MYAMDVEESTESLADMAKILERAAKELRAGKMSGAGWKLLEVEPGDDEDNGDFEDSDEDEFEDEDEYDSDLDDEDDD